MCHIKWIFTVAFTILEATSIDVTTSSAPCKVKVELLDRMINVVNKDELCLCLKYEKAISPHKTSETCNLNIKNSGGNLIISADSMCECAGYETNSTLKNTTGYDIPHVTITKASTADDMRSKSDRIETVTYLPTNTTIDDKVKDKILLSNSSVTEALDLAPTTNGITETKKDIIDYSKRLTTYYTITTKIPFVYAFKNSSTAIESGTTEEIEETKPTTQEPKKSKKMLISSDTHLLTNTTIYDKVKDKITLSNSSVTEVLDLTSTTNGITETKKDIIDYSKRLTTDYSITTKIPFVYAFKNSSTAIENGTTEEIEETKPTTQEPKKTKKMHISYFGKVVTTDWTTDITTPTVVFTDGSKTIDDFYATNRTTTSKISLTDIVRNSTTTTDTTESTTLTKDKPLVVKHFHTSHITDFTDPSGNTSTPNMTHTTDKLLLVLSNATSSKTDYSTRESYSSSKGKLSSIFIEADTTESLSTTNKKDLLETILTTPIETIASTTVTDFGYKRVIPISTTSRNNYTTKIEHSKTTTPNVRNKSTVSTTTEVVYHINYTGTDGYTKVKSTKVDAESAGVITEGTSTTMTRRNNYTTKIEHSRTTTPNVRNKSTVSTTTEVVYHINYTGTDGYTKVKSTKVDAEIAGVITEGTSTTMTPITLQSTTDSNNSSYTESDTIKGAVISYTNITLITILTIICVVLIIQLTVKIINSCLRKGSYVLPHESDGNIEMDCKK